jgi:hypothetical protein
MSMSINLEKFKSNLPQPKDPSHYPSGLFIAIEAAHNECRSEDVDWNSFTLADAEMALDHAMCYEDYENLDEKSGHPNQGNAVHEYLHNIEAMDKLKRSRPVNQVVGDVKFF